MPAQVWNGSTWKKVLRKTMWTGTAWKDIKSSHRWTGSAWETIYSSFTPSGMTKSGTFAIPNNVMTKVEGWAPDVGSTVSAHSLVVSGSKSNALLEASVVFGSNTNRTYSMEVRKGTEVVASASSAGTASGGNFTLTITPVTIAVADADLLTVWARYSFSTSTVLVGTFVKIS